MSLGPWPTWPKMAYIMMLQGMLDRIPKIEFLLNIYPYINIQYISIH